jgi:site-specific recombinase XerD
MAANNKNSQSRALTSPELVEAYTDFLLSRQSMQCSPATMEFYKYTSGVFLFWLEGKSITSPKDITARHVRAYLAELAESKKSDWTLNDNARAIRTVLKFFNAEGYMPNPTIFAMPKIAQKRLLVLSAEEVGQVLKACSIQEKAIILLMVDTGLRRSEVIGLDWGDVDMQTGLTRIKRGKGGKARSVVMGAITRRALLSYRRQVEDTRDNAPLIQSSLGGRFTGSGLLQLFRRIHKTSGVPITPHSLRRTFVILSLRAGMDPLHLQALLGHGSLEMVYYYAQMQDEDLLQAHNSFSPIDNLHKLK